MSVECQVNVKSQSELDIGGRETCAVLKALSYCSVHKCMFILFKLICTGLWVIQ